MRKQVIVVVHGVGVRESGVSTDLVSAALDAEALPRAVQTDPGAGGLSGVAELRPHSSDDFCILEDAKYASNGKRAAFSARLRRFRANEPAKDGARIPVRERVIADFYWGDISGTGTGPYRMVLGLLKIVLGLSHAVRENAVDVFPKSGPGARDGNGYCRCIADLAVMAFHGPIVAINLALLGGLLVKAAASHLAVSFPGIALLQSTFAQACVLALILGAGGLRFARKGDSFLIRLLAGWCVKVAVLIVLLALVAAPDRITGLSSFGALDRLLVEASCRSAGETCFQAYNGLYLVGLRLWAVMALFWTFVTAAGVLLSVMAWLRRDDLAARQVQSFLGAAIGLMLLLWLLVIGAVWAVAGKFAIPVPAVGDTTVSSDAMRAQFDILVTNALRPVVVAVIAMVLVGGLAAGLHIYKGAVMKRLSPTSAYLARADLLAERHRLIVARCLLGLLVVFLLAHSVVLFVIYGPVCDQQGGCGGFLDGLRDWTPRILAVLAFLGALLVMTFGKMLATGIAVFTDILVYLNDYDWNTDPHREPPDPKQAVLTRERTVFQDLARFGPAAATNETPCGYWLRDRIRARLVLLVDHLIKAEEPDELVLVSHSQGTVISIDVLARKAAEWRALLPEGGALDLVTMGSPYSHLYNRYFPTSFPPHRERENLVPGGVLDDWVNIFRVDDFVGTHIDLARNHRTEQAVGLHQWPREFPVPPNGHTMYWVDQAVMVPLREALEFRQTR